MIVEKPPPARENLTAVSGRDILTNEQVNILSVRMIYIMPTVFEGVWGGQN